MRGNKMKHNKMTLVISIVIIICTLSSTFVFALNEAEHMDYGNTEIGYRIKPLLEKLASLTQKDIDLSIDSFTDVRANWSKQYVGKLTQLEILAGYGNGKFGPQDPLRINEFIKMIVTAMGFKPERNRSDWAAPYVSIAREQGIIGESQFADYTREITREEMTKILYAAAMKKEAAPDNTLDEIIKMNIRDSYDIGNEYVQDVLSCYRLGILRGTPEYFFNPKKTLTRAEGSVVIINYLDVTARNPFTEDDNYAIVLNNYARERELVGDDTGDAGEGNQYVICRPDRKEEIGVIKALKNNLDKSKGYGYVQYNETGNLIGSTFFESAKGFYEDKYAMHVSLGIFMRENDPITYTLNISRVKETKELHKDVVVEFLKSIFGKDAQRAINEFDIRLDAALSGERLPEEWITIAGKEICLGKVGNGFRITVWKYKPDVIAE